MIKRLLLFLFLFVLFFSVSCSNAVQTVSVHDVSEKIKETVPLENGYYEASTAYFDYFFPDVNVEEWIICRSSSQDSENEFGILKVKKDVSQALSACENYLDEQLKSYIDSKASYSPKEYEKFRDATVRQFGNYIVYTIMTKNDSGKVFDAVKGLLLQYS